MNEKPVNPRLTLVGAGPGDPELITVKAIRALESADAVLYDALVDKTLLDYCPDHALKVFVGKRAGKHSLIQDKINEAIVSYARSHGHVVRLKGGDPFVFGRGFEEILHAEANGITTEVVPGISSSYGVPTINKLPLTSRGKSDSFWVLTGTTKSGELSNEMKIAVKTSATIVVLMGMKQIDKITQLYIDHKKTTTPIAIIQNGSMTTQKIVVGQMDTIQDIATKNDIGPPALIFIGEVTTLLKSK